MTIMRIAAVSAALPLAVALTACGTASGSSTPVPVASVASAASAAAIASKAPAVKAKPHPSAAATRKAADPSDACYARPPASGDILLRFITPGIQWTAQRLGGGWIWNVTEKECLTSVQMMIATAPLVAGACTQVAYAADNPGYDEDAAPAAPLKKVVDQAGPAC